MEKWTPPFDGRGSRVNYRMSRSQGEVENYGHVPNLPYQPSILHNLSYCILTTLEVKAKFLFTSEETDPGMLVWVRQGMPP